METTNTSTEDMQEAALRLQKEVEEQKGKEAAGLKKPTFDIEEALANRNAAENILSVGDAIKTQLEGLKKAEDRAAKFAKKLKEKLAKEPPVMCETHSEVRLKIDQDASFAWSWHDDAYVVKYLECELCAAQRLNSLVNEKMKSWGIPKNLFHATFNNFDTSTPAKQKALKKVQDGVEKGGFIILRGSFGTGKSHLSASIVKQSGGGRMITMADLVAELRASYDGGEDVEKMVAKYRRTKCFVLDELSTEVYDPRLKKNLDVPPLLYRILAPRYDEGLLTVITSNEPLAMILDILGPRLTDRICENYVVVTCEWDSFRKRK